MPELVPPDLPIINIKDSDTAEDIPVALQTGYDTEYLQPVTKAYLPLDMDAYVSTGLGAGDWNNSGIIWTRRCQKVIIQARFSTAGASCVIRPYFHEFWGGMAPGDFFFLDAETHEATSIQDGSSLYMAVPKIYEVHGAAIVQFQVESITAGTVNVHAMPV